jgi:hypothetical protein
MLERIDELKKDAEESYVGEQKEKYIIFDYACRINLNLDDVGSNTKMRS